MSLAAKGQLVAKFTASATQACSSLPVQFTDQSTGNPTSWLWDFGNGNTSTKQNPSAIYFTPGQYSVKLVVSNGAKKDSLTLTNYIVINKSPDVDFAANVTTGCAPVTTKFTDKSVAGSGTITKWQWDFGDGTTSLQQSPSHTFSVGGDFTITLKVTNSIGCVQVYSKSPFVHVNQLPKASFTSGSATSCKAPVLVNFVNSSITGANSKYRWNFGDGSTSTLANPSHNFTAAGTYPITLTVTNQSGCVDSVTKPTVIGTVTPDFSIPAKVCQGTPITFSNTSQPAIASAQWFFSDNSISVDINAVKTFTAAGTYSVKLVNNFGACSDSITKTVTVLPKPVAGFSLVAPASSCKIPLSVPFTASTSSLSVYAWDFGDGGTATGSNVTHSYATYGTYSPKLVVKDANGCTDTAVKNNAIELTRVQINSFANLPFRGCIPRQQTFAGNITTPEPITSYLWNFGDGHTSTSPTPVNNYTDEGSYDVSLKIVSTTGCTDSLKLPAAVVISKAPVAKFSAAPIFACAYQNVQFTNSTTGNTTGYVWDFGDNTTSSLASPEHRYKDTGFFTIKLIATNNTCDDTLTVKNYVHVNPPVAVFTKTFDCNNPLTRTFQNLSIGAQTIEWNFGDGTATSSEVNPVHTYAAPGTYIVHLHVTNNDCYDDFNDTLKVIDEKPDFTLDKNVLCRNNTAVFTAINIDPENVATYTWNFGDNTPPVTVTTPTISYNYLSPNVYTPTLTITDKTGCIKTTEHPVSITIYGPKAGFANPPGACVNSLVSFTDQSVPTGDHPLNNWIIIYGDGKSDTSTIAPKFTHTYAAAKGYDVMWIVADSYGCKDTLLKPNAIIITQPKAAFSVADTISCKNSDITFNDQSHAGDVSYLWHFGDNSTANTANPVHAYSAEGSYTISLAIKDAYGCVDSIKKTNAILIKNAKAAFALSDSVIQCPPAQIEFKNNSTFFTSVTWDFDDGNFADINDPSHYFNAVRTYNIKLTAFGHGSCADSIVKVVTVKGPTGTLSYSPLLKCAPATVDFKVAVTSNNIGYTWDFGDGSAVPTNASTISHEYTSLGKFLPKVLLIDTVLNCKVSVYGTDTITVSGALSYITKVQSLFCDSSTVQFIDSSAVAFDAISSYQWNFGDGSISTSQNPTHHFSSPGNYPVQLVVQTIGGCSSTSAVTNLKIVKSPQVDVTGPDHTCVNQPIVFTGVVQPDTSAVKWSWTISSGTTFSGQTLPPQTFTTAGNYTVDAAVTNSSGCKTVKSNPVKVNPLPDVFAGQDTIICRGTSITLHATGADNYTWVSNPSLSCTNCANPVASPVDTSVQYYVTGTNALTTCESTDSLLVKVVQPFKIKTIAADTLCVGQSVQLSVVGADHYNWTPAIGLTNANIANPIAKPDTTTLYAVTGHDFLNCFTDVAYVPIAVYPIPVFNIVEDNVSIAVGNSITLHTTSSADVTNWEWFPASGLSCSTCQQPVATPIATTVYKAIASNGGRCRTEDKVTINVFCNNGNTFIPNTFSPNNDGSNDVFYPRGKGIAGIKNMLVFNRWGTIVFQKSNFTINDPSSGWDGTFNGKQMDEGVYIYQIDVICETGQIFTLKGDITLIR